jgi:hypothetical protein
VRWSVILVLSTTYGPAGDAPLHASLPCGASGGRSDIIPPIRMGETRTEVRLRALARHPRAVNNLWAGGRYAVARVVAVRG